MSDAPGSPEITTEGQPQAETALITSRTEQTHTPVLVTTYNDVSIGNISTPLGSKPEFEYGPVGGALKSELEFRSGASFMGWATSPDGESWEYRGKIRPQPSGTSGQWALVGFDPSLAVDGEDPEYFYAVQLGVSQATFDNYDTSWQGNDADRVADASSAGIRPDGFCVARSNNGGEALGRRKPGGLIEPGVSSCIRPPNVPPFDPFTNNTLRLDKTAATVDWLGRLWVAIEDHGAAYNRIRVFHNLDPIDGWDSFVEVDPCAPGVTVTTNCIPSEALGDSQPVLRSGPPCNRSFDQCAFVPSNFSAVYLGSISRKTSPPQFLVAQFTTNQVVGAECNANSWCLSGSCDVATHMCNCASDAGCPAELSCTGGKCQVRSCGVTADCPSGLICNTDFGACEQVPEWAGENISTVCATDGVPLNISDVSDLPLADGTQSIDLRGAFAQSFNVGWDFDGATGVVRVAYLYRSAIDNTRHIGIARYDGETCTTPVFQDTALLTIYANPFPSTMPPQEFQPVLDWHDRIDPVGPGSDLEWQLAFLGTNYSIDRTQRYINGVGMTLFHRDIGGVLIDTLEVPLGLHGFQTSSTQYACPFTNGYWGDYFGLTQFYRAQLPFNLGPSWMNAATFTKSAFKPKGASASSACTATATKVFAGPVDVNAFTWPSLTYVFPPF